MMDFGDRSVDDLAREYAAMDGTDGGRVIDVDRIRELSPEYRADRSRSHEIHAAASRLSQQLFERALVQPVGKADRSLVVFTAGGSGSGKSTAIGKLLGTKDAEITLDGTFSKLDKARERVRAALDSGRRVEIRYVYRSPENAAQTAIRRAISSGRAVPTTVLAENHVDSLATVRAIAEEFKGDKRVSVVAIYNNTNSLDDAYVTDIQHIPEVYYDDAKRTFDAAVEAAWQRAVDADTAAALDRRGQATDSEVVQRAGADAGRRGADAGAEGLECATIPESPESGRARGDRNAVGRLTPALYRAFTGRTPLEAVQPMLKGMWGHTVPPNYYPPAWERLTDYNIAQRVQGATSRVARARAQVERNQNPQTPHQEAALTLSSRTLRRAQRELERITNYQALREQRKQAPDAAQAEMLFSRQDATQEKTMENREGERQDAAARKERSSKEFHKQVAERLIEQLRAGTAPWQRPWQPGDGSHLPVNPTTGQRYRGINVLQLMSAGHSDPRWMTYRQAQAIGAQVRKGEKGTPIQHWRYTEERDKLDDNGNPVLDAQGKPVRETVRLVRPRVFFSTVFNASQIDGLPPLQAKEINWVPSERAAALLSASGVKIEHAPGDRAFYRPSTDIITMPFPEQFQTAAEYYGTVMHELGHATGHESRLNRPMLANPFGSAEYAKEELRAEIASLLIGEELGIGHDPGQHAAYVQSWIKVLENDPSELYRACADAEKIFRYVMALEQQQELSQDQAQTQEQVQPVEQEQVQAQQQAQPEAQDWLEGVTLPEKAAPLPEEPVRVKFPGHFVAADGDGSRYFENAQEAQSFVERQGLTSFGYTASDKLHSPVHKIDGQWWVRGLSSFGMPPEARAELPVQEDDKPLAVAQEEIERTALANIELRHQVRVRGEWKGFQLSWGGGGMPIGKPLIEQQQGVEDAGDFAFIADPELQRRAIELMADNMHMPGGSGMYRLGVRHTNSHLEDLVKTQEQDMAKRNRSNEERIFLDVPFTAKDEAKQRGARWDDDEGAWYILASMNREPFAQWIVERSEMAPGNEQQQQQAQPTAQAKSAHPQPTPVRGDLGDFIAKQGKNGAVDYHARNRNGKLALRYSFRDHGSRLTVRTWKDEAAVLAALQLAAEKWGAVTLTGSQKYREMATRLAQENGITVTNPALITEDAIVQPQPAQQAQASAAQQSPAPAEQQPVQQASPAPAAEQQPAARQPQQAEAKAEAVADIEREPAKAVTQAANIATEDTRLYVSFDDKDLAKKRGAKWHKVGKYWFAPKGSDLNKFAQWREPKNVEIETPPRPEVEFADVLRSIGGNVTGQHPIMDGKGHRMEADGDTRGEKSIFYVAHLDGVPNIYAKNNRTGEEVRHSVRGRQFSPKDRDRLRAQAAAKLAARAEEQQRLREASAERVRKEMMTTWSPVTEATPYMRNKGIAPCAGVFTDAHGNTRVPGMTVDGVVQTEQSIPADGKEKRFPRGSSKTGCFHPIDGDMSMDKLDGARTIIIAEGFATAASIYQAGGLNGDAAVVAAFDAGNLKPVAEALHAKYPDKPIIIAGDDDVATKLTHGVNPGREKALEAAKAVGGEAIFPNFVRQHEVLKGVPAITPELAKAEALSAEQQAALLVVKQFSDFNDLAERGENGRALVQMQISRAVSKAVETAKQSRQARIVAEIEARKQQQQRDDDNHRGGPRGPRGRGR